MPEECGKHRAGATNYSITCMLFGPKWLHGYQTGGRLAECPESPCELVGTLAVPAASAKSNAVEIAAVSAIFFMALSLSLIFFMAISRKV
jgi:hypothetical protein